MFFVSSPMKKTVVENFKSTRKKVELKYGKLKNKATLLVLVLDPMLPMTKICVAGLLHISGFQNLCVQSDKDCFKELNALLPHVMLDGMVWVF